MSLSPAAARIRDVCNARIAEIAERYYGPPKSRTRRYLRFGHGVQVDIEGRYAGRCKHWASAERLVDGLGLIQLEEHCKFAEALAIAAERFGLPAPEELPRLTRQQRQRLREEEAKRKRERANQLKAERGSRHAQAVELWARAAPMVAHDPGDRNFRLVRQIEPHPDDGWPANVVRILTPDRWPAWKDDRWLVKLLRKHDGAAIVCAASFSDGSLGAVHLILVDRDGRNIPSKPNANGSTRNLKFTRGIGIQPDPTRGRAMVRIPPWPGHLADPPVTAEGVETAWSGGCGPRRALLCALAAYDVNHGEIVLADDDAPGSKAALALEGAQQRWDELGRRYVIARPFEEPRGAKEDFNDLRRQGGSAAVEQRLRLARWTLDGLAPTAPPFAVPTGTLAALHTANQHAITRFFAGRFAEDDLKALRPDPPRMLLRSVTGSRKSDFLIRRIISQIPYDRDTIGRPHRVIVTVPAHRLGKLLAQRYIAAAADQNIRVAVYEGRGDPNKEPPPGRKYLCQDLDAVGLALKAAADVNATVCGQNKPDQPRCRFRAECAYFMQLTECSAADILIIAHNYLFDGLRDHQTALLANVNAIVIEEDISDEVSLGSIKLPLSCFDREALDQHPVLNRKTGEADETKTDELNGLYAKIQHALDLIEAGESPLRAVHTAGLGADDCAPARKLTWRRKIPDEMYPGMPRERRLARAAAAKFNLTLPGLATALHAFEELAASPEHPPQLDLEVNSNDEAAARIWVERGRLHVPSLKRRAKWVEDLPVIWASTTTRPERARQLFPGIEIVEPPSAAAPHQHVHQHLGAFGKSAIERTPQKLAAIEDFVRLQMLDGTKGLVIPYQGIEHCFSGIPGVKTLHHGSVAGDDDFASVDKVFVIGGPFAQARDIADIASAEARRRIPVAPPEQTVCAGVMEDGTGVQFRRLAYTRKSSQAVHAGIYDSAIVQAIGRARGINRTAATVVEIYVLGNVPLPMPLASIERFHPISRIDKMVLAGAVHTNPADMRRFFPLLFPSADAARQARRRWGGASAMRAEARHHYRRCPEPSLAISWQPNGQGHRPRTTYVLRSAVDAFHAHVLREFPDGLATWNMVAFTSGAAPWRGGEDPDTPGKEASLPGMSDSSSPSDRPPRAPSGEPPRWAGPAPPDA
jgi:hypothetical protein